MGCYRSEKFLLEGAHNLPVTGRSRPEPVVRCAALCAFWGLIAAFVLTSRLATCSNEGMTQRTTPPQTITMPAGIGAPSCVLRASINVALISIITVQPSAEYGRV